jgi:hypothetical protein
MKRFIQKPYRWAALYSAGLALLAAFVLLDAFVIPRAGVSAAASGANQSAQSAQTEEAEGAADTAQPVSAPSDPVITAPS